MPSAPPQPLLSLRGLCLSYPGRPVLRDLTADLQAGVALVCGDEGSGKSSLLRVLAGQQTPDAGELWFQGRRLQPQDVAWFDPLEPARDARIVRELLAELAAPAALPALIEGLALAPHLDKPLYQLSTGSRRKVFLAAALSLGRPLTLLDQPFMALDRPSVDFLLAQFRPWADERTRLLLIADYLAPEGLPLAATLDLDTAG